MDEFNILVSGALLHDIGKFVQRANWSDKKSHEAHGEGYLRKRLSGSGLDDIALFAGNHHSFTLKLFKGNKRMYNLLRIVCEADNISSMERDEGGVLYWTPLKSVFSSVNLGKEENIDTLYYYPLPLNLSDINFPKVKRDVGEYEYKILFDEFDNAFTSLLNSFNTDKLLMLLEKYTSFIPSKMSIENDISLFDHLKSTAAIASCMYQYHLYELDGNPDIDNRNTKKYLFVAGDMSGIQDFIYNITSKGALKYLRARSAFLEFLTYDIALEIIDRLKLTFANIIYIGGGNFYLLLPNTDNVKSLIIKLKEEVNRWLLKEYDGDLYFSMAYVDADGNSVMKMQSNGLSLWDAVNAELKKDKQRKFYNLFEKEWWLVSKAEKSCKVCGKRVKEGGLRRIEEKEIEVCKSCYNLWGLGDGLLRAKIFIRSKEDKEFKHFKVPFSKIYLCKTEDATEFSGESVIFVKNSFDPLSYPHRQITYLVSDYAIKDNGSVKSFDKMNCVGANKIALLKMDVDNLGKIFSDGLRNNTPSRSSMLSRLLNLFFKGHLNTIVSKSHDLNTPRVRNSVEEREIVVIYSGGDDLVIGGSWNDVFEAAFEIREFFRRFVGYNPNITISGGYAIFEEKMPMIRMAYVVSSRLDKAKDEGKNRIYLMDRNVGKLGKYEGFTSYEWNTFIKIWKNYASGLLELNGAKPEICIPRSLIYKLLEARDIYVKDEKSSYWFIIPMYYLSRKKESDVKKIFSNLFRIDPERAKEGIPQDIFFIDVPLKIVDLAVRG